MITIRPLDTSDAERYKTIRLLAVKTSPTSLWPTLEEVESLSIDEFADRLVSTETQAVFGAFALDTLVGITGVRRESLVQVRHQATIWGVFVDPEYRRNGIAQKLLNAATEHARQEWDCIQMKLYVNAENAAAKELYLSQGFVIVGMEPRALRVGDRFYDEERMHKVLR
ncbi:N-acetyltransferase [Burkholderia sp. WAC0059]|uniref:GNAT family N-acetyltransferase n=1 Tax=Burkholderia sp. WAC0059 TaxID=2066022 RepID=UPI000C7F53EC|nr:N-acetyltransferase [Burkholderia sp. WAC0059]PLZ00772.1 N-acetyltransferase [Burkholderia sp. WAC0059]